MYSMAEGHLTDGGAGDVRPVCVVHERRVPVGPGERADDVLVSGNGVPSELSGRHDPWYARLTSVSHRTSSSTAGWTRAGSSRTTASCSG